MIDRSRQKTIQYYIDVGFTEKEALIEVNRGHVVGLVDIKQEIDLCYLPNKWKISFINQFGFEAYIGTSGYYAVFGEDAKELGI